MTLDTTINLPTLITLGLTIIGLVAWFVRLEGRVGTNGDNIVELEKSFGALQGLVTLHKEQFHEYQLQVARDYTTHAVVSEIKRDIITEIGRMEQRVETQISRLVDSQK